MDVVVVVVALFPFNCPLLIEGRVRFCCAASCTALVLGRRDETASTARISTSTTTNATSRHHAAPLMVPNGTLALAPRETSPLSIQIVPTGSKKKTDQTERVLTEVHVNFGGCLVPWMSFCVIVRQSVSGSWGSDPRTA